LSLLDKKQVTVYGAGRTDAGVHADAQVANFFLEREFDTVELRDAINGNLDRDIRVTRAELIDDSFDARFSAKWKTYRYQIWTGPVVSPFFYRYVYHHRRPLDLDEIRRAAAALVGEHDFSAFTVMDSEVRDHTRLLKRLDIHEQGSIISIEAEANGFLRYMVRTIVGTLMEVGRGRRDAENVHRALRSLNRTEAGPTAPAAGLTLARVDY
ncbi:MAG TPA: tRNA pseudouridine(38-40) synthase TruA, partial [Pyrinomonadaceae bacterium]|nr:tRNA pseudouridine(38-40) synthase TruA [Pyrinomonadaceae bacterium]